MNIININGTQKAVTCASNLNCVLMREWESEILVNFKEVCAQLIRDYEFSNI